MLHFYRKHYAPETNPVLNVAVYAGIALKFVISLATSAARRRIISRT